MAKANKKNKAGRKMADPQMPATSGPNWPLAALALVGAALTTYLTATYWLGEPLAGCPEGSSCDVVLSSRWSVIFGLPTSFWGFLAYGALVFLAFIKTLKTRWKLAWMVSLFGALFSLYLTAISVIELDALCPYCAASSVIFIVILGVVTYQFPGNLPRFSWRAWLIRTIPAGLIVVALLHLHFTGILGKPAAAEDRRLRALAQHLVKNNAKFYGAYWCPHCAEQKEMFGASGHRLPYIECSPQGRRGSQALECRDAGIRVYPTWIINGRRLEGVLSISRLSELTNFQTISQPESQTPPPS